MKKSLRLLFVCTFVLSVLFVSCSKKQDSSSSASTSNAKDGAQVIKFGFIGPLSGDYANYGTYCRDAALLAINEFNSSRSNVAGFKVELVDIDSAGDNNKALAAVEKLSSDKNVIGIVGPVITSETFVVADRCQNEGLTVMTPSASHKDITNIGDYIFRTTISDGLQGEVAGAYFAQKLGYKRLASLYTMNDYSKGLNDGMTLSFEANPGCKVVIAETCNIGDKDFRSQLTRIKNSNAEAIYIPNYTEEMAQILEQAAQLNIKLPFVSGDGFSNPIIYQNAGAYTDGVVYVAPPQVKETSLYSDFVASYNKATGHDPDSFATNMFDATNIFLQSVEKIVKDGKVNRSSFRDAVASTKDYQGASGVINFAQNGDLVANQGIYKVNGTTPVFVGEYKVLNGKIVEAN